MLLREYSMQQDWAEGQVQQDINENEGYLNKVEVCLDSLFKSGLDQLWMAT